MFIGLHMYGSRRRYRIRDVYDSTYASDYRCIRSQMHRCMSTHRYKIVHHLD